MNESTPISMTITTTNRMLSMTDLPPIPSHVKATYKAYAQIMAAAGRIGRQHGISPAAVLMVAFIGDQILMPTELRNNDMIACSNLSYNIMALHKAKLVTRIADTRDKRANYVRLTEAGLKLCADIRTALALAGGQERKAA